jgi:hypothetical protein
MHIPPFVFLAACALGKLTLGDDTDVGAGDSAETVGTDGDADTDADTDTDADSDTDTETDPDTTDIEPDTGYGYLLLVGDFATSDTRVVSGHFGYAIYGIPQRREVCTLLASFENAGPAPDGCPDCEWSFTPTALHDTLAEGDQCDDFDWTDGYMDGYQLGAQGFASSYDWDYGDNVYHLEDVVFLDYNDVWTPWIFNYGGSSYVTPGDRSTSFWTFASSQYYYYTL